MMSGTSLDGLDLALCTFEVKNNTYTYAIERAQTVRYPEHITQMLKNAYSATGSRLQQAHLEYGTFLGTAAKRFLNNEPSDFIASHGHTVFHQPREGYTFQLGSGRALAHAAQCDVVCDFRTADVLRGGEGAPLVPVGDKLLFAEYEGCMNLGGYINLSYRDGELQPAFDIAPMNTVLNLLAQKTGKDFDEGGNIAQSGTLITDLYADLNALAIDPSPAKQSLGTEWLHKVFLPVIEKYDKASPRDALHTVTRFLAEKTASVLNRHIPEGKILVTGGGTKNAEFMSLLKRHCTAAPVAGPELLIDFKEALIFAFLGVLRLRGEINVLAEATGARQSHCAGEFFPANEMR